MFTACPLLPGHMTTVHEVDPSCTQPPEEQQAFLSSWWWPGRCGFAEGGGHLKHRNQMVPGKGPGFQEQKTVGGRVAGSE